MQGGFFLLLRFFLRVDGVLVRINDTRIYHKVIKRSVRRNKMLRVLNDYRNIVGQTLLLFCLFVPFHPICFW